MKVFSQAFKIILASIFFASTAFSADVKANSNQVQTFKIIPKKENKDLEAYIEFQILPDNSILFSACQQKQCHPLFDQAIPKEKFDALLEIINQTALSKEKPKPIRDFLVGAGVTHISGSLITGIMVTLATTYSALGEGFAIGMAYLLSPAATAFVAAVSVANGGMIPAAGAMGAVAVAAIGAAVVAVAVLGGLGYVYYKRRNYNKTQAESGNTLEMNATMAELKMMVQTLALGLSTTPSSLMP